MSLRIEATQGKRGRWRWYVVLDDHRGVRKVAQTTRVNGFETRAAALTDGRIFLGECEYHYRARAWPVWIGGALLLGFVAALVTELIFEWMGRIP